ncbi:ABC transporter ATP-binding protein [Actinoallomurus sp. CA-150999]|uniref:ABC transporter ATP-binding protein n=1 Tax=Actinoallomurus sp. CA-150999 TaxID=3239887 RepID=UPI003D93626C
MKESTMGDPAKGPAVVLSDLRKSYGDVRAVDGVNLTIGRGETVALLGPNGAGKSTTINMLLGLLPPDGGSIELLGRSPRDTVRAGKVGAMPQDGGLIPRVTVKELVGFVRQTYQDPPSLEETLRLANLTELAGRRVDRLSGGQAQRVRFALALAGGPDVIVLDEPTAALDVAGRRDLWQAMRSYAERGKTLLFSTHYMEEADDYAERVVVIAQGRVIADGSGADIKKIVGGRTVSFDLGDGSVEGLDRLPGVTAVEVRGGRAHLTTTDPDATVAELARRGDMRNVEVVGTGLEEAFLALTANQEEGVSR